MALKLKLKEVTQRIVTIPVGPLDVNCYLVYPVDRGTLYIIDPGGDPLKIMREIAKFEPSKYQILLTHAHVDHISAAGALCDALNLDKVMLNPRDAELYNSPQNELPPIMPCAENLPETEWVPDQFKDFDAISTSGHTFGSVCYYFKDVNVNALFSGDTLFAGSVGRTDLPGSGEHEDMISAIRKRLFTLPDDLRVFPGHGPETTIGEEKQNNPFFQ